MKQSNIADFSVILFIAYHIPSVIITFAMTNLKNKTKDWIRDLIFEHTKPLIVGLFTIIGVPAVLLFLKNWLKAEHSLTLSGWYWLLIFLVLPCIPFVLYIAVTKARIRRPKYLTEKNDIEMAIIEWLKEQKSTSRFRSRANSSLPIRYDSIDAQCKLKPGTAKRYLPGIVEKYKGIEIVKEGDQTVALKFRPSVSISHSASGQTLRE